MPAAIGLPKSDRDLSREKKKERGGTDRKLPSSVFGDMRVWFSPPTVCIEAVENKPEADEAEVTGPRMMFPRKATIRLVSSKVGKGWQLHWDASNITFLEGDVRLAFDRAIGAVVYGHQAELGAKRLQEVVDNILCNILAADNAQELFRRHKEQQLALQVTQKGLVEGKLANKQLYLDNVEEQPRLALARVEDLERENKHLSEKLEEMEEDADRIVAKYRHSEDFASVSSYFADECSDSYKA